MSTLAEMAGYARSMADAAERMAGHIEHIRNLTESNIEQAKDSIGGETVQQLGGEVADVCDTVTEQVGALRTSLSELQRAIQNAGG